MNVRRFGTILLLIAAVVLAVGAVMWITGVPDDGRYHVEADGEESRADRTATCCPSAATARRHRRSDRGGAHRVRTHSDLADGCAMKFGFRASLISALIAVGIPTSISAATVVTFVTVGVVS